MKQPSEKAGTLYVVATPIGNLDDITIRAIQVLQQCDLVACEDTRHSKRLFQAHGIDTKTQALHQHNEHHQAQNIIDQITQGFDVALISDAGTPLISDPGYPLLQLAHEHQIRVVPIPGPSALIALLSVAAVQTQPFMFHGFLPPKSKAREAAYQSCLDITGTHVFYESSHRIVASVTQMQAVLPDNCVVVMGRELTKTFERVFRGSAADLLALITADHNQQKGEFVLAIENRSAEKNHAFTPEAVALIEELRPLLPPKQVAQVVANCHQLNKKEVYQFILNSA